MSIPSLFLLLGMQTGTTSIDDNINRIIEPQLFDLAISLLRVYDYN